MTSTRSFVLAATGLVAASVAPAEAVAQPRAARPSAEQTVHELVDQVLLIADAIETSRQEPHEGRGGGDTNASGDADTSRAAKVRGDGLVPYARTIFELVKGEFAVRTAEAAGPARRGLFLQLKPKGGVPYFRCEFQF